MNTAPISQSTAFGLIGCLALCAYALPGAAQPLSPMAADETPTAANASTDPGDAASLLSLTVGQQQRLNPGSAIARIAVGDPAMLDVKVLRDLAPSRTGVANAPRAAQLLLTPKAAGRTTLMVWPVNGLPHTQEVSISAPRLLLERRLGSVPQHAQVLAALGMQAPKGTMVLDRSEIEVTSNTVQVDVQVVEFKKSALRRAGMNLKSTGPNAHGFEFGIYTPGSSSGTRGSTGSDSGSAGSNAIANAMNLVLGFGKAGISAQLGFMESNGLARVLAKPTLVAHTGQSASFLAGGEIPIPVPGRDGNVSIEYKEFGVKLQLTPTILSNERIALKIAPEASDLDYSQGVTIGGITVPAMRTRRADTMVELADGESFIIGGLVSRSTISSVNKIPLLSALPILGAFFKNLSYSQDETELLIIVTPRLVHPLPAHTDLEALLPGARSENRNAAGVWAPYLLGAPSANSALPGFSY